MGAGKIINRIVREVIEKIVATKKEGERLTFSRMKNHTLWQHQKYMGHMDYKNIYRP